MYLADEKSAIARQGDKAKITGGDDGWIGHFLEMIQLNPSKVK